MPQKKYFPYYFGIFWAVLYGLVVQFAGREIAFFKELSSVMTTGYVFCLPFVMGVVTIACASPPLQSNWFFRILMPWVTTFLSFLGAIMLGWEGLICAIAAGVIAFPVSSLGGILAGVIITRSQRKKMPTALLVFLMLTPSGSALLESRLSFEDEYTTVRTQIPIAAGAERVWQNIIRVPAIEDENITGFFYKMGFPKPIEATLSHEGVGGVRQASFAKGLLFIETVTDWQERQRLAFTIQADPAATPLTTLDEHVVVGGRYFDVLQGTYEIEKIDDAHVVLHLSSRFRLSTNFNFYARLWGEFLMRDIQNSILKVIQGRCES